MHQSLATTTKTLCPYHRHHLRESRTHRGARTLRGTFSLPSHTMACHSRWLGATIHPFQLHHSTAINPKQQATNRYLRATTKALLRPKIPPHRGLRCQSHQITTHTMRHTKTHTMPQQHTQPILMPQYGGIMLRRHQWHSHPLQVTTPIPSGQPKH